jgi:hypothetical protein
MLFVPAPALAVLFGTSRLFFRSRNIDTFRDRVFCGVCGGIGHGTISINIFAKIKK